MTLSPDQAVDLTRSGDIWLFRGRRAPDRAIRAVTNSPVNHVGMAVVVDGQNAGTKGLTDCPGDAGEMNFDCGFDITTD